MISTIIDNLYKIMLTRQKTYLKVRKHSDVLRRYIATHDAHSPGRMVQQMIIICPETGIYLGREHAVKPIKIKQKGPIV